MEEIEAKGTKKIANYLLNYSTLLGMLIIGAFIIYGYKNGLFTSTETFRDFIVSFGIWAPIIFIFIQIVQVIIPILPGAISCVVGIIIFGPWIGLLYNYIGICIGSIIVFLLAQKYGKPFVRRIVGKKSFEKYIGWVSKGNTFDKIFAYAIFFPIAPDDLLCYIAGLTKMKLQKFIVIILLGKPLSITIYSLGLTALLQYLIGFIK
ncbi:TVP38/TMEM64 family protein [Psychrobacillus soli]|uniref:TVP38/TMEM64 family membrane protein n=1 Tax=Psychrobacillus soli TaxID=1543965 RepID=A0A544SHJ9_9BACI|nr:TVP38/TMEM64 family protein [Psychrobacillus soli]TQR04658.1 TVP38/TMEM64 family protein [Psychrobacillus soli]